MEKEEVTLKEMILTAIKWGHFFFAKWKIILIAVFLGGAFGIAYAFFSKPVFKAHLTLALEENRDATSAYSGIASQFGIDIGGGGGGAFSGENNIELLKSRYLIEKALLTPVVINGQRELLVNRYIAFNKLHKKWRKDSLLATITFNENELRQDYSIVKDSVLFLIYGSIKKKALDVTKVDRKLSIITVDFQSKDEIFAKLFTEALVGTATKFYIETKTKRARQTLSILENRLDSVKRELDKEIYGAAQSKDQSTNTIRAKGNIQSAKKQLNVQVLTTMYGELVKNSELAKYTLLREEPLIQVIDTPIFPLEREEIGIFTGLIVGGFLGGFFAALYFWVREMKRVIMDSSE